MGIMEKKMETGPGEKRGGLGASAGFRVRVY